MPLANTSEAIGAVTRALMLRIGMRAGINVLDGQPDHNTSTEHLNLFLYEISYDPTLKNLPLDEGQKPPLWMVLKYLLTAFDTDGKSDSFAAHMNLGKALRAIHEDDLLKLDGLPPSITGALDSNPDELHVTFDESSVDLLAKLMQSSEENLRISIAFQVRPVMIASTEPPDYSLLVGINYTETPPALTPDYVGLDIIPSMGAVIEEVVPKGFEIGEEISVKGTDMHLSGLSVRLGAVDLPVTFQRPDELRFKVDANLVNGAAMSAGSLPLTVMQTLASGKKRASNMFVGNLVPTLTATDPVLPLAEPSPGTVAGTIDLEGLLLGVETDDAVLALYRDGRVFKMFDVLAPPAAPPAVPQTARRLVIAAGDAVPAGEYLVILRVNGQQAPQSPKVILIP